MSRIYRYEKLEYLENMLWTKTLTFILPYFWDDAREGFLFRAAFSDKGLLEVARLIDQMFGPAIAPWGGRFLAETLRIFMMNHYGQCWSRSRSSPSLWQGKDLRFEIDRDDVARLPGVKDRDMLYADDIGLVESLRRLVQIENGSLRTDYSCIFTVKHRDFASEEEVRLLSEVPENVNRSNGVHWLLAEIVLERDRSGRLPTQEVLDTLDPIMPRFQRIPFGHIDGFIKSVIVHPGAPIQVVSHVKALCEEHSLPYQGTV